MQNAVHHFGPQYPQVPGQTPIPERIFVVMCRQILDHRSQFGNCSQGVVGNLNCLEDEVTLEAWRSCLVGHVIVR